MNSQKTSRRSPVRGELWGTFSEFFGENILRDIDIKMQQIFNPKNALENHLCKMPDILFRPQFVKREIEL